MPERWVSAISRDEVEAVARLMDGFPGPWFVAGGWAIDLFLGRVSRVHEDLEIGVARVDQGRLRDRLQGWQLYKLVPGESGPIPWARDEYLELPIHQIVVRRWDHSPREFEFFLNEIEGGEWRFRKLPAIRRPLVEVYAHTAGGIPIIAPEIQLLHKAGGHRPKDERDFQNLLPHLERERRSWLRTALELYRPGDPWLEDLALHVAG